MNPAPQPQKALAQANALRAAWHHLKTSEPRVRNFDAAQRLGVSELALLLTDCGQNVTRLKGPPRDILPRLEAVGPLMALTRNPSAVIEKVGVYEKLDLGEHVGLALGEAIDLRLFFSRWRHACAVESVSRGKTLSSIHIYDGQGRAVHKIYRRPETDAAQWAALLNDLAAADQSPYFTPEPEKVPAEGLPDAAIDVETFQAEWLGMKDTHEFHGLLRRHSLNRTQALRLAPEGMTTPIPPALFPAALERAAATALPIMIFVGNPGAIEIHTGPITKLMGLNTWFNIMDPGFNLHVNMANAAKAWVVRKPTADGVVTSIELFDHAGETILMMFGARKPGVPELEGWRDLVSGLLEDEA